MDPEEIARARAAIAAGANPQAVAERFRQRTGMELPSPAAEQMGTPEEQALRRTNARGGNALTDFLAMVRHNLTLGADDDIADYFSPGAGEEIRQRIADRRLLNPGLLGAAALSEIAGGVALPVGAGGIAVRGGKGLLAGVLRGAATGGAMGGAQGFFEATGTAGDRAQAAVPNALVGAAVGGATGALPGLLNAASRRGGGRGARVGQELAEATELPTDFPQIRADAKAARGAVSDQLFGPIDDVGPIIPGPRTAQALASANVPVRPRTLTQLQKLEASLRRSNPAAADELRAAIKAEIGGLEDAFRAYAPAAQEFDALKLGRRSYKTAADVDAAMEGMSPAAVRNFRTARLHDILARLNRRDDEAVGLLRDFLDAGDETQAQLRTLFPEGADGTKAFNGFLTVLRRERSAERVARQLPYAAGLITLGGGGYVGLRGRTP